MQSQIRIVSAQRNAHMHSGLVLRHDLFQMSKSTTACSALLLALEVSYEFCFAVQLVLAVCIENSSFIGTQVLMASFSLETSSTYKCHLQYFIG